MIGIIGGSGLYEVFDAIQDKQDREFETPYGIIPFSHGIFAGHELIYISRHGRKVRYPPHRVNYHGHIWALHKLGVKRVIATSAVGSVNERFHPGDFVLPDQYLDLTREIYSFYNGGDDGIFHADMTDPFCPLLFKLLTKIGAEAKNIGVHSGGCYACLPGPAFETRAEIKMVQILGGDLVGMTTVPEAKLTRELGLCYYPVTMVVNWGAGISSEPIEHEHTVAMVGKMLNNFIGLISKALGALKDFEAETTCHCDHHSGKE